MSDFTVKIDDSSLKKMFEQVPTFRSKLEIALDKNTAFGLQTIKTTLPKRSGNNRNTYQQKKTGELQRVIFSNSPYAVANEEGATAHTVYPKRAKFLMFAVKPGITNLDGRIKQSVLNQIFSKGRSKGKNKAQIRENLGVVFAKKANIPAIKGNHLIENVVTPKVQNNLETQVGQILEDITQ